MTQKVIIPLYSALAKSQQEQYFVQNWSLHPEEGNDNPQGDNPLPSRARKAYEILTARTAEGMRFSWLRNKAGNLEMMRSRWSIVEALQSVDSSHKRFGGHCSTGTTKGRTKIRSICRRGLSWVFNTFKQNC